MQLDLALLEVSEVSDTADDVGKIEPDFDTAEVRAFRADGSGDARAEVAGRADIFREFWMDAAQLGDFVHGSRVDLFLGVEASSHSPFVKKVKE